MNLSRVSTAPYMQELLSLLTSWIDENPDIYLDPCECYEMLDKKTAITYLYDDGASRMVISHESWDFVIKIDHFEFENKSGCAREVEAYQKAKDYGIEEFLLPIAKWIDIGLPNGCLYVQQKADCTWRDKSDELSRNIKRMCRDSEEVSDKFYLPKTPNQFISYIIKYFGEDFVRKVLKWCAECKVNDLHGSNCGFVGEAPKLLDYAGFWD